MSQLKIRTQEIEAQVQVAESNVLQFSEEWQVQVRSKCRYQHARGASSSSFWSSRSISRNSNFSRGSSPTRSSCRRGQGKEISKIPCRFFKSGRYKRGDTCPFMYETSAPAAPIRRKMDPSPSMEQKDQPTRQGPGQGQR